MGGGNKSKEIKSMNTASTIRDKILAYALRRQVSQKALEEHGEELVNRRILTPLCVIDIAYGIWQEKFVEMPMKQECKLLKKRVQKLFNEGIFNQKGVLYGSLDEDEICYLSDHSDNLNNAIKDALQKLYYSLQRKMMDMPTEQRDACCNMLVMETILLVAQSSLYCDWSCQYPTLDKAIKSMFRMAQVYRQQVLGNKDTDISFTDEDNDFINCVKIINKKIYEVAV